MKKMLLAACVVSLVSAANFQAHANAIITDPGPGFVDTFTANVNAGYDFTVGSTALMVTSLGLWDGPQFVSGQATGSIGDGFASEHVIGLWDNSGNLLAKAVMQIGTGDTLVGEFRYSSVLIPTNPGPVILSAGMTYVLGAAFLANDPDPVTVNFSGNQATFDPAVSPGNARGSTGGFSFPSLNDGPGSYVGPNAMFTLLTNGHAVPETGGSAALLLISIMMSLSLRRVVRA